MRPMRSNQPINNEYQCARLSREIPAMSAPKRKGRAKGPDRGGDQARVTVWLPKTVAKTLRIYCAAYDCEMGKPIAMGLQTVLAGFYVARRDGARPSSPAEAP